MMKLRIELALWIAYVVVSYRIAWKATPLSRPFGTNTVFLFLTWPAAWVAQKQFERTGKWPKWYPAL